MIPQKRHSGYWELQQKVDWELGTSWTWTVLIRHVQCSCDDSKTRRIPSASVTINQVEPAPILLLRSVDVDEAPDLVWNQNVLVDEGKEPGDLPASADALDLHRKSVRDIEDEYGTGPIEISDAGVESVSIRGEDDFSSILSVTVQGALDMVRGLFGGQGKASIIWVNV